MKYIKNFEDFNKCFSKRLYEKIVKETSIKSIRNITKEEYNDIKRNLYEELTNFRYKIGDLDERIFAYKSNKVARIIPVFKVKDELMYYFLCKMLEDEIVGNRVVYTYGGWRLGNKIRLDEDAEIEYVYKSYNPYLWNKNWKDFQNIIYMQMQSCSDEDIILKLDIANFYDNINLSLLENKLLACVDKSKLEFINMLMYFLKNWNLSNDKYFPKYVGIPQNEFGDQSRILANFYIQEYDEKVKEICDKSNAVYIRYADDQIVIVKDKTKMNDIRYVIAKELNKLGLNLNASKVKEFNKETICVFYGIPVFKLIEKGKLDEAAEKFFELLDRNYEFNYTSSLKRFLNIGFKKFNLSNREKLKSIVLKKDFLIEANEYYMQKIYDNLLEERGEYVETLLDISAETTYNSFHYNLINFIIKNKIDVNLDELYERIEEIKKL